MKIKGMGVSGPAVSKKEIKVKAYIHEKDEATRSKILHIDIESPILNKIIKPGEATYCAGKQGGMFIGLKKDMIKRAEALLKKDDKGKR